MTLKLLLHFDGSDGSTTFTDSSLDARTVTATGNAQLDTAQKKFGTASLELDGTGDRANVTSVSGLSMTGDFTIEGWFRGTASQGAILSVLVSGDWYVLWYDASADTLNIEASGGPLIYAELPSATGTWHHFAWVRNSGTQRLYLDGVHDTAGDVSDATTITPTEIRIGHDYSGLVGDFAGHIDEIRISVDVAQYTGDFTPPSSAFPDPASSIDGLVAAPGPLDTGSPAVLGSILYGQISASGPLGSPAVLGAHARAGLIACAGPLGAAEVLGRHDFTEFLTGRERIRYLMRVTTPDGEVTIPISSWQATLTTDGLSYAQCVIPGYLPLADTLTDATDFAVSRVVTLSNGLTIEASMAVAPIEQITFAQGSLNQSCTLAGYTDAYPTSDDPDEAYDRTLTGIRTMFSGTGGIRVRCTIDWLLRPGQRAWLDDTTSMIVKYINLYVPEPGGDEYMDVGELLDE